MNIDELFEEERANTFFRVMNKYKDFIINARKKDPEEKVVLFYKQKFQQEKNRLFHNTSNSRAKYHFIVNFYTIVFGLDGGGKTLEEKIAIAERLLRKQYRNHDYLPEIEHFLSQDKESIARKLAHFDAYCEIEKVFSLDFISFKRQIKNKVPKPKSYLKEDIEQQFIDLFKSRKDYTVCREIINKHLCDEDKQWKGIKNQKQEIPILVSFLKKHHYIIEDVDEVEAVNIFCRIYNITMTTRSMINTEGKSKKEIFKYFQSIFPIK